jgi:hypothetical protein
MVDSAVALLAGLAAVALLPAGLAAAVLLPVGLVAAVLLPVGLVAAVLLPVDSVGLLLVGLAAVVLLVVMVVLPVAVDLPVATADLLVADLLLMDSAERLLVGLADLLKVVDTADLLVPVDMARPKVADTADLPWVHRWARLVEDLLPKNQARARSLASVARCCLSSQLAQVSRRACGFEPKQKRLLELSPQRSLSTRRANSSAIPLTSNHRPMEA